MALKPEHQILISSFEIVINVWGLLTFSILQICFFFVNLDHVHEYTVAVLCVIRSSMSPFICRPYLNQDLM